MNMYNYLLEKAAKLDNSLDRLVQIAIFTSVRAAIFNGRVRKPFNSLLGETYEIVTPSYRMICEQVSHHPPISAVHTQGDGYLYEKSYVVKVHFNGRTASFEDTWPGILTLSLDNDEKEVYTIKNPKNVIGNLIIGEMYVEPAGTCEVINNTTGEKALIEFAGRGYFSSQKDGIKITIKSASNDSMYEINGQYTDTLELKNLSTGEVSECFK